MSYLRQLTQQARGQRLPGQPRPLRSPATMRWLATPAQTDLDEHGVEAVTEEAASPSPDFPHRASPALTTGRDVPAVSRVATSPSPVGASASHRTTPVPAPDVRAPATRDLTDRASRSATARFDSLEALLPAILDPRRGAAEPASLESARQQAATEDDEAAPDRAPAPTHLRERTVPPRAPARPATRPDRATQSEAATLAAVPAVPDVHIHIGRVELTALQPPAPRPAPRREEKKPMSLEEYLRQRDGRRS